MPEYTDVHGVEIVYDLATPVTTPRGVIHLLHGVGEHAGRYGAVIGALTDAGFIVYADDHRGHGRTGMRQHGSSERLVRDRCSHCERLRQPRRLSCCRWGLRRRRCCCGRCRRH